MLETHSLPVAHREPRRIEEIDLKVQERFQQVRKRIRRIAVIAIEGYDDRPGCAGESSFVGAPISANVFANDLRSERLRHFRGSVG